MGSSATCNINNQHRGNGPCSGKRMCEFGPSSMYGITTWICKEARGDVYFNPSYGGKQIRASPENPANPNSIWWKTSCYTRREDLFGKLYTEASNEVKKGQTTGQYSMAEWARNGVAQRLKTHMDNIAFNCTHGVYTIESGSGGKNGGELFLSAKIFGNPPRGNAGWQAN